jgi:hypothetical protein
MRKCKLEVAGEKLSVVSSQFLVKRGRDFVVVESASFV